MDLAINIQDGQGQLTLDTTSKLINNIFMSLEMSKGSWWFDENFGSRLDELKREKDVPRAAMLAVEYAKEALAWLVDTKRAAAVDATTSRVNGGLILTIVVIPAAGDPVTFEKFVPVGV